MKTKKKFNLLENKVCSKLIILTLLGFSKNKQIIEERTKAERNSSGVEKEFNVMSIILARNRLKKLGYISEEDIQRKHNIKTYFVVEDKLVDLFLENLSVKLDSFKQNRDQAIYYKDDLSFCEEVLKTQTKNFRRFVFKIIEAYFENMSKSNRTNLKIILSQPLKYHFNKISSELACTLNYREKVLKSADKLFKDETDFKEDLLKLINLASILFVWPDSGVDYIGMAKLYDF